MGAIQIDLLLAIAVSVAGLLIGSFVGAISATVGGWLDSVTMRVTDVFMAFPAFVLALVITASLGNNALHAAIGVTIAYIPQFIRLTRAQALQIRSTTFSSPTRLSRTPPPLLATHPVLPHPFPPPP